MSGVSSCDVVFFFFFLSFVIFVLTSHLKLFFLSVVAFGSIEWRTKS